MGKHLTPKQLKQLSKLAQKAGITLPQAVQNQEIKLSRKEIRKITHAINISCGKAIVLVKRNDSPVHVFTSVDNYLKLAKTGAGNLIAYQKRRKGDKR